MAVSLQPLFGLLMMGAGGLKIWLHINASSVLALPTCNGQILQISLNETGGAHQLHCWGCYMFAAGLVALAVAIGRSIQKRRSVASWTD